MTQAKLTQVSSLDGNVVLETLCQFIVDCEHKTAPTQATGYPSIRTPNIGRGRFILDGVNRVSEETYRQWTRRAVPQPGDLIMAREAPVGNVAKIPVGLEVCLGQRTLLIRPDPTKVDADYLTYLLLGPQVQSAIHSQTNGATVPHLNMKDVRQLRLPPLPSLSEQRRVAGILSAYDDLIGNCERRIRVLDDIARALFAEVCPVSSEGNRLISVQTLIDDGALEVGDGYRAKNSELGGVGIPFARAGNIDGGFNFEDADLLAEKNIPRAGRKVSRPGDIVFTSKGTVGRFALVREGTQTFVYSPQLCFWRSLNPGELSVNYLYLWMQSREFLQQVDQVKGTTDMADYVSLTNQRRMKLRLPSLEAQRRLDLLVDPVARLVGVLTDRIQRLRSSRELLLPRLVSGQLNVSEAA